MDGSSQEIRTTGWFRYAGGEGVEEYYEAQGHKDEAGSDCLKDFTFGLEALGPGRFRMSEVTGGHEVVNDFTLDQECDYDIGPHPELSKTMVVTSTGEGRLKVAMRNKSDGGREDYNMVFGKDGLSWTAKDWQTGKELTMRLVPHPRFLEGQFRTTEVVGMEGLLKAMGFPPEAAEGMKPSGEDKFVFEVLEDGSYKACHTADGGYSVSFRLGEPYDCEWQGTKFQCLSGLTGDNALRTVMTSDKYGMTHHYKATRNFLVVSTQIHGSDAVAKSVCDRI